MSSAMEFAITTDLTPLKEFNISANFEECQAWLEEYERSLPQKL